MNFNWKINWGNSKVTVMQTREYYYFLQKTRWYDIKIDRHDSRWVYGIHWGHPYTTWSARGRGVYEITMIDHEGEGTRNDHVVTWTTWTGIFCAAYFMFYQKKVAYNLILKKIFKNIREKIMKVRNYKK